MRFWLKNLKSFLNYEKDKNWKLSININLSLRLKLIYFSIWFGMTFILKLNLSSSCIIKCEFLRLWNAIGILWFNFNFVITVTLLTSLTCYLGAVLLGFLAGFDGVSLSRSFFYFAFRSLCKPLCVFLCPTFFLYW